MLTVSGVIYIAENPVERPWGESGSYFNLVGVGKTPETHLGKTEDKNKGRQWYRISIFVKTSMLEVARETLQRGKTILIRIGELQGMKMVSKEPGKKDSISFTVKTNFDWIEVLNLSLNRKEQQ